MVGQNINYLTTAGKSAKQENTVSLLCTKVLSLCVTRGMIDFV